MKEVNNELDALVSEFLAEEKKMLAWMDAEKRKYLAKPEKHRDYADEWNYFYEKKCQEARVKVHPSMIRDEWDHRWEKFISEGQRHKIQDEGIRLLRKYGLRNSDIREYQQRQQVRKIILFLALF